MRAMILAAGFGTRLWPLTIDRTKPAIPFLNKPLIQYSVEFLRHYGINEMVVNLHHQGESIRHALGNGQDFGVDIYYSEEPEILGTSGALDYARQWFEDSGSFVVMNGKVITDINLAAALATHKEQQAIATLILLENQKRERFSEVILDEKGDIARFGGFPQQEMATTPLMFTGIQILSPEIFDYIPRQRFSHSTTDVYPKAIADGRIVAAHVSQESWYELSTLARYLDISLEFLRREGRNFIADEGSVIDAQAKVQNAVLWRNVAVGAGAELNRVIIGDEVCVPAGLKVENAIIVRRDRCQEIERGEIVGDNLIVPIN